MKNIIIINGKIVLKNRILLNSNLVISNGIISDITENKQLYKNYSVIDAGGNYISPGFVEMHIHGCGKFGVDFKKPDNLVDIVEFLKTKGINTLVPTLQCDLEVVENIVSQILSNEEIKKHIPGIYIEGPFINKIKKGGIFESSISAPDIKYLNKLIEISKGYLKLMTIAPEISGNHEMANHLVANGIIPCFGHSNAKISDIPDINLSKTNITHLFNAMSEMSHKESGLAMLPFLNKDPYFELNADGVHVNDEMVKLCYNHLNREKLIIISDASISAGLEYGEYKYYSKLIVSNERGVRYKDNDVLMGSNLLVNEIMKIFINLTKCPIYDAVRFVSTNPSTLLNLNSGSIEIGKEANLILLDEEFNMVKNLIDIIN